jgi:predicted outer membrane repeat protein
MLSEQSSQEILSETKLTAPTITNCIISNNSANSGGGMRNYKSNPTLTNCTFTANLSYSGSAMNNYESNPIVTDCTFNANSALVDGGGIYNNNSTPTVTNCSFSENSSEYGAAMFNYESSPIVTNCTFSRNYADYGNGGGMYNDESNPVVTDCNFSENSSHFRGGGMYNNVSNPMVTNCTFNVNLATVNGGGMCNLNSSPTLTDCIFSDNSNLGSGREVGGGGMSNIDGSPTLTNCIFTGNSASQSSGGGIYNTFSSLALNNCIFSYNSSQYGGAVEDYHSTTTLTNCLFSINLARWYGGAIYNHASHTTINNSTFSDNHAFSKGGAIYSCVFGITVKNNCIIWNNKAANGSQIYLQERSIASMQYTNLRGGQDDVHIGHDCELNWGLGNIDADPCFVRPPYSPPPQPPNEPPPPRPASYISNNKQHIPTEFDYHLLPGSPCINAGDPNYLVLTNETDLDGNPRVIGCRIDMGAYEYSNFVQAELRITPHNINLANKGKSITAYLLLPENYNVADSDLCVLLLEDQIQPRQLFVDEEKQILVAGFSYEQLFGILDFGDNELTVSAQLKDATCFRGTDLVKIIYEGGGKSAKIGQAGNPDPPNGAIEVSTTADLSWSLGYNTASHDVYFGTANPPPFIGNQTATTFDPGTMDYETVYYWRIDEINKWGIAIGDIWSFITIPFPPPPPPPPPPGKPPGAPPGCFPADTPVWIDGAQVQISKVTAGRKVGRLDTTEAMSCFEKPVCSKEIESVLEYQGTDDCYNIVLETGNRINVVHSHYFLTASDQWVPVENLKVGSKLQSLMGPISIRTIAKRETPFTGRFYNLKIKGGDRYFVGKDGVVVRSH